MLQVCEYEDSVADNDGVEDALLWSKVESVDERLVDDDEEHEGLRLKETLDDAVDSVTESECVTV